MNFSQNEFWFGELGQLQNLLSKEPENMRLDIAKHKEGKSLSEGGDLHKEHEDFSLEGLVDMDWDEEDSEQLNFGDLDYMVSVVDRVAVLEIQGDLVPDYRWYHRMTGDTSYEAVKEALWRVGQSGAADAVLLNVASGGGSSKDAFNTQEFIARFDSQVMPVYSYAKNAMCSAAYLLGSTGREIYGSRESMVGSIGVIQAIPNLYEMYRREGVEWKVMRVGQFKALGDPREKWTEEAEQELLRMANSIYDLFLSSVAENLNISVDSAEGVADGGRVFLGQDAVSQGLIKSVMPIEEVVSLISSQVSNPATPRHNYSTNRSEIMARNKCGQRVLTARATAALASGVDPKTAEKMSDEELKEAGISAADMKALDSLSDVDKAAMSELSATQMAELSKLSAEDIAALTALSEGNSDDSQKTDSGKETATEGETKMSDNASSFMETLQAKVMSLTEDLAMSNAKVKTLELQATEDKAALVGLAKVAELSIGRMQIAMGGTANAAGNSPALLVELHEKTLSQFNGRFSVGGRADTSDAGDREEHNLREEDDESPHLVDAARNATRIGGRRK